MEDISLSEEETGLQGKSVLCVGTKHNTRFPVIIVTVRPSLRYDQKVS